MSSAENFPNRLAELRVGQEPARISKRMLNKLLEGAGVRKTEPEKALAGEILKRRIS